MFYYLYYPVTMNKSKEKFRIVFCFFSAIKHIVAPSSSSNFPTKLIYLGMIVSVCLDKAIPIIFYLSISIFYTNNLSQ